MSDAIIYGDGSAGPSGPPPVTALTLPFTMPVADGTTQITATCDNVAFLIGGATLSVQNAGAGGLNGVMRVFATPLAGATSVQLVNPVGSNNVASGTAVPAGSQIAPSGALGPPGPSAFTTVSAPGFTMPAQDGTTPVSIPMGNSTWTGIGAFIFIATAGWLQVTGLPDALHVTAVNPTGITQLATPGTVIAAGVAVTAAGAKGPQGSVGSPGPTQLSVANAAALAGTVTTVFLPGLTAYVQALKAVFIYDPTSVLTPDNINVIAAQGGGCWVSIASITNPGILGSTTTAGGATVANAATDWASIAAGQSFTIFSLPAPTIGTGEQVTLFAAISVQSNLTPLVVSGATNASPIVLAVSSTANLATGSQVGVVGVAGNTAANGGWTVTVIDATHVSLNGSVGNGAYTGGGVLSPADFGHFKHEICVRNIGGNLLVNAQGTTTDADLTVPVPPGNMGPTLASTSVTISPAGFTLSIIVTAPATVPVRARMMVSWDRAPIPGAGPAPVLASYTGATHGPATGGGTLGLVGTNFTGAFQVTIDGIAASFVVNGPTSITATIPNSGGISGTGPVIVSTPNGSSNTNITYTYDVDPSTIIASANLKGWWRGSDIVAPSNVFSSWPDARGGHSTLAIGSGAPTYAAASAHVTPAAPSVSTDGAASTLKVASFPYGTTGDPIFIWVVARTLGGGNANGSIAFYTSSYNLFLQTTTNGTNVKTANASIVANWGASILNQTLAMYLYADGSAGASKLAAINVSNGTEVDATGTLGAALTSPGQLELGGDATFGFTAVEFFEVVITNTLPTTSQRAALEAYAQAKYTVP